MIPTYDANGNVTNDSNHTYSWDSDGNSVTLDSVGLTFDALDRMVEQNRSGSYTQILYGPRGGKLALMNGQTLVRAFISLPGQATAIYTSGGLDHYRHSDHLGSARLTSSPSQSYVSSVAYAPFGETYSALGTTDPSFTGQSPDTVSTNYDFLYREYSNEGRWASPDRAGRAAVNPSKPQSWNRYSYVRNMPAMLTDPLGFFPTSGGGCDTVKQNSNQESEQATQGNGHGPSFLEADNALPPEPDPPQARCGGGPPPCAYTLAGCGGGGSLDGGFAGDDSGIAPTFTIGGGDLASQIAAMQIRVVVEEYTQFSVQFVLPMIDEQGNFLPNQYMLKDLMWGAWTDVQLGTALQLGLLLSSAPSATAGPQGGGSGNSNAQQSPQQFTPNGKPEFYCSMRGECTIMTPTREIQLGRQKPLFSCHETATLIAMHFGAFGLVGVPLMEYAALGTEGAGLLGCGE